MREPLLLFVRAFQMFGRPGPRGPETGPKVMVIPGFLATDHTTLPLQRALAKAGFRVTGWGMGLNKSVRADTLESLIQRVAEFAKGEAITLVGWSLGGIYAREVAKKCPRLVQKVVTLGAPFSGNRRANNVWRFYEWIAGHPVDDPPVKADIPAKPPVPTIALWSSKDGIVAPACARGNDIERDEAIELHCTHMGFALSSSAFPAIIAAVKG